MLQVVIWHPFGNLSQSKRFLRLSHLLRDECLFDDWLSIKRPHLNSCYVINAILIPSNVNSRYVVLMTFLRFQASQLNVGPRPVQITTVFKDFGQYTNNYRPLGLPATIQSLKMNQIPWHLCAIAPPCVFVGALSLSLGVNSRPFRLQ